MKNAISPSRRRIYWSDAVRPFTDTRMLVVAALIVALRVAVKFVRIPLAGGLFLTLDCYVNALGSLIYGPLMGLAVGAVSDTLGCLIAPTGPYFLPFIFIEMSSSFLFGLFFWHRKLTLPRILTAKFTVNAVCNILLTSVVMKWSYYWFYGLEKAEAYAVINLLRIVKNLALFPMEALLIALLFRALLPLLHSQHFVQENTDLNLTRRHYLLVALLFLLSVGLVFLYIFVLKDFFTLNNVKWL